ncbi:OsmC family protein [Aquibaculum arenosum]|uniref:OsmC family protein n=1 Tax=Aquibaculum arenosum TaxID=3032591 RepID=A0ABT5YK18_9PROT|nr:OsmC family protein [Fodinicurvata sp. CAU 1616]MDF2095257.1 OsmC family protein [Fodinicurvata sp. CAU 1616]
MSQHRYVAEIVWTGNRGAGTANYRAYGREHEVRIAGKPPLLGSADPAFRGDASRHNPEDLLLVALSACHLLWYLHLCAEAGVVVMAYEDPAEGRMVLESDGGGRFVEVTLRPRVTLASGSDMAAQEKALALHAEAHARCFIARSVNFPVRHEPEVT